MAEPFRFESHFDTHTVFNQSTPYEDVDLFSSDVALQQAVRGNGGTALVELAAFGRQWGSSEYFALGRAANEYPPVLQSFDAHGFRRDVVEYHPAYHALMRESIAEGLHASTWTAAGRRAVAPAEVERAACFYMAAQVETGHLCPITMTRAALAALAAAPELAGQFVPKALSRRYDGRFAAWPEKAGITLGMGMTEKQGGTDVRANTARAVPVGGGDGGYAITGHKWFMSAPMSDAFLVLAQASGGLTCFLMPRFRPDGTVNGIRLQRLKDKLGNRSNASAEVEFVDAFAWCVGDEGAGIRTILQMVQLTRLDCAIASAGLMRMALAQAMHHASERCVFGRKLAEQPMMRAVLADLALDLEAAVALVFRLSRAHDRATVDPREAAYARLLTPAIKFLVCKLAPQFIYEAMESLGGNGYVEESLLPRLYREAPVNAIWEGSGNVMGLDVLRALRGDDARELLGALSREAGVALDLGEVEEGDGRHITERIALVAAAAALRGSAPDAIATAFIRTRLDRPRGALYGTAGLAPDVVATLIDRVIPV